MNTTTPTYTEGLQKFLSAWQQDHSETFNIVNSTIQNIEDSFQSTSSQLSKPSSETLIAKKFSDEPGNTTAETLEIQSASTISNGKFSLLLS